MVITPQLVRRCAAVAQLLKIHLQDYPEHVVAQAIAEARKVLITERRSAHRAILVGERHAQTRVAVPGHRDPKRPKTARWS
jgi:hypothetical protein